eukprot:765099-Hanusia_phi.AAC.2
MAECIEEHWAEVNGSDGGGESSGGEWCAPGNRTCPGKETIKWQNKSVYIQISESCSQMFGCLSIRVEDEGQSVYIVWNPADNPNQAATQAVSNLQYAICTHISQIYSIRLIRPSLGTPQHATLTRCDADASTLLVNDSSNMLQRSLHGLDMVQSSPGVVRSRAPTKPSTPDCQAEIDGDELEWSREIGGEWQWRYLQGGVRVMQGLRSGWKKASAVASDVAASAAELLDQIDTPATSMEMPLEPPHHSAGSRSACKASDLRCGDDECVFVEHEPLPWEDQGLIEEAEFRGFFEANGRIRDIQKLRRRAYYGGFAPNVRRDGWKWLLGCYPVNSTRKDREHLLQQKAKEYEAYRRQWESITADQESRFSKFRDRRHRIEKDVIRTDRSIDIFVDDNGEGLQKLYRILLTYSFYNFDLSYCQGMSDLAAPLLVVMEDEKLMDLMEPNFHKDQNGMHTQLQTINTLCKVSRRKRSFLIEVGRIEVRLISSHLTSPHSIAYIMPCYAMPHPILSYPILSYHIISYPILSYPILSYPILSYPILSYHNHVLSHPFISYPIT